MTTLRAGIIGTGMATGIAAAHYRGYEKSGLATVTAVYNRNRSHAKEWMEKNQISGVEICDSLEDFWKLVDVVSICTPNNTHLSYMLQCLEHGKHVLCEKPVGQLDENMEHMLRMCEESSLVTMMNFNYRQMPGIKLLEGLIQEGKLGDIILYRHTMGGGRLANEKAPFEWRMSRKDSGSGALGDFGSHMLDAMSYLLGCEADSIRDYQTIEKTQITKRRSAEGFRKVENDDCAVVQGVAGENTLFTLMMSRVGSAGNQLEIIGTKGIAHFSMELLGEVEVEYRKDGSGFTGEKEHLMADDTYYRSLLAPGERIEMAACSANVIDFVHAVCGEKIKYPNVAHGVVIEKILEDMDRRAEKIGV